MLKRIFTILFLLVCLQVFAEEQIYEFNDFSKGQNSHSSPYITPDKQGVLCQNVRVNSQYGSLSKRDKMLLLLDGGTASINGLHRYYKSDDTQQTIFSTSTGLYYNASGTATALETGFTDGAFWQFTTYMDKVIGWNGSDKSVKWDGSTSVTANTDGHRTSGSLVAELGAPFAELNTGANLDASSWYQYKVAFYDGTSYTYSTARSNPILTGADVMDIYLTDIPLGPTGTTHRYIYRTLGNSSKANVLADTTYYLVGTIADNSTKVLADTTTDDDADDGAAPTWATASGGTDVTPPIAKYGTVHRERLFLGNTSTESPSYLYWSDEYNPDYFASADYEPIREDDGGQITGIVEFLGLLTVLKDTTIQYFYTDSAETSWYTSPPFSKVGCPAPYSIAVTPKGIFYYGRKGIYTFIGNKSELISDAVTNEIRDISPTAVDEIVGYYFDNEYLFSYTSDSSGDAYNNRVLIYDLIRDAYVLDYKDINCFVAFDSGDDYGVLYSGSSGTDGYIYAHEYTPTSLSVRYKSELDAGTFDDMRTYGTENFPYVELAWDCTIDGWLTELQTKDAEIDTLDEIITYLPDAIVDRPDTDGTWTSPVYDLNAGGFDRLYWHENLGVYGNITFQLRAGATSETCQAAEWSTAVSDPSGSDVSAATAGRYVQLRINGSTSDIDYTPILETIGGYMFELVYYKTGSTSESSFLSKWDSGWKSLGFSGWKDLKRIRVFYTGTSGTLNIKYYDQDDDDNNFDIDLSRAYDSGDGYSGYEKEKVYTYFCPINEIGRLWRFEVSEEGTTAWKINKIEVKYDTQPEID